MGFMEMSCREPEEVSYGSGEQRRSSLTKRRRMRLIVTASVKREQPVTPPSSLPPSRRLTQWDYVKHQSPVTANKALDKDNES